MPLWKDERYSPSLGNHSNLSLWTVQKFIYPVKSYLRSSFIYLTPLLSPFPRGIIQITENFNRGNAAFLAAGFASALNHCHPTLRL